MAVHTTHFDLEDFDINNGGKGIQLHESGKVKLTKQVDLRAFYKEMFLNLQAEGFEDGSEVQGHIVGGNPKLEAVIDDTKPVFEGMYGTRASGMYEKKLRLVRLPNGPFCDFETTWHFRKKTQVLEWWFDFTMDIACRNFEEVEVVLEGGKKKKMVKGTWEFRNKFYLCPSKAQFAKIVKQTKIFEPFVSSSRMANILLNHVWFKKINYEKDWCGTSGIELVYRVIDKYFK